MESRSSCDLAQLSCESADWNLQPWVAVLGQLFLVACVLATLSIAAIFFILFGPVPVNRKVIVVPRLSAPLTPPMPSLVAQLAPAREQHFTPAFPSTIQGAPPPYAAAPSPHAAHAHAAPPPLPIATTPPATPARKPKGQKVQPLPRKRAAKGTESPQPFAPVVRSGYRQMREEEVATNPVPRVQQRGFESEEFTMVDDV